MPHTLAWRRAGLDHACQSGNIRYYLPGFGAYIQDNPPSLPPSSSLPPSQPPSLSLPLPPLPPSHPSSRAKPSNRLVNNNIMFPWPSLTRLHRVSQRSHVSAPCRWSWQFRPSPPGRRYSSWNLGRVVDCDLSPLGPVRSTWPDP